MKTFLLKLLIAFLIFLNPLFVWAEPVPTLTLDQAIQTALSNNPQLKAAQARLGVSEAEILTAGARLNPALMTDNGVAEKTYRLGIEQTFELGGKRHRRIALSQAQRNVVLAEVNTILLDTRANVRRAYTQLFNMQERQHTVQEIYDTTLRLLFIAKKREEAGDIATVDALQADIANVNAGNDLQTVGYQILQSRSSLNALLSQPLANLVTLAPPTSLLLNVPVPSPGTFPLQGQVMQAEFDVDQLIQDALTRRPEVQQNLRNLEVTQRQLDLAKASRIPNLTLAAGPDLVTETGQREVNVFVIGNLELPVFNRQQGPIQEAMARRIQLEQEQAALKNRIGLEVTDAYLAFQASQDRVKRYETELLPKAQVVVEKSRRSFEEGKSSILIPLNAQQAYQNTQLGYLQALMDTQNAISDLERAVGTGL